MTNGVLNARKALGFTTQQLADAVGVHRQTVIGWETGRFRISRQAKRALVFLLVHQECGSLVRALAKAREVDQK